MFLQPPVWEAQPGKAQERTVWESALYRGDYFQEEVGIVVVC